jgi:hypothetical protein
MSVSCPGTPPPTGGIIGVILSPSCIHPAAPHTHPCCRAIAQPGCTRDRRCERGASDVGEVGAHHHPQRVGLERDLRRGAAADLAVDVEVQGRIGL